MKNRFGPTGNRAPDLLDGSQLPYQCVSPYPSLSRHVLPLPALQSHATKPRLVSPGPAFLRLSFSGYVKTTTFELPYKTSRANTLKTMLKTKRFVNK
ncbi:hypothetical protein PoB_007272700 [Plakobranchus ocellatus]|uniref:Uncharacterized protein n=1 Tax=Plakobranchus ocellatus TaxID=259542 RepID=A0AAV4DQ39_9GAST|nr:hypothetical protein PoB_007272700 [Plakobranchus ocellatus]